ncbi:RNA polymerase subunit sigma-24 [Prevotella sp. HMSC073D09]|jgi:RNA polymerase sigma factor, sigma-70 family|uniref:RNA polymerase sigma factor n=1 Tax=unclassified Prevotella TaxID=2638335 RepID=UPI0001C400FA|nr:MULTISPECIES: sigma-70 family RNA polymerase sigma factor [unclassified Prevotella]EFC69745.1 Sigma-70 region 2 [Prevotella sp. oral taxon 317 str. F0108]OFQ23384.1 RNA polymerase subunit sigma-24 [Prevotella sp. HMSC073D09]
MIKISEMTDEELAMSYVNGNNKAFDLLLERNQSRLFSYILFIVHDRSMAEDLFQETFVKIISKLHEGKYSSSGKFVSWMLRIAHNAVMDWYRRQKNEKTMEVYNENDLYGDSTSVLDANIENHFVKEQVLRDVQRMMNLLPITQREVVFMRFYQNLSFKEIAELTNVSINTALGRMRYAVMNMRRMAAANGVALQLD